MEKASSNWCFFCYKWNENECQWFTFGYFHFQPLTSAERKRKYIEKLKADGKFEQFKKDNASKAKQKRDRIKVGLNGLPKNIRERTKRLQREYTKRKVAECRQRKKADGAGAPIKITTCPTESERIIEPYRTPSALAKAVSKVKRALPSTTEKRKEVIRKIFKSLDPADQQEIVSGKTDRSQGSKRLSTSVVDEVVQFYARDEISRISPNVKDCRKFFNSSTGAKEYKQIRFLIYKLTDVYAMFVKHIQEGKFFAQFQL